MDGIGVDGAIAAEVVRVLAAHGFETLIEPLVAQGAAIAVGAATIVGWHAASRSLVVVAVDRGVVDIRRTLSTLGDRLRAAPAVVEAGHGWRPASVSYVLALPA